MYIVILFEKLGTCFIKRFHLVWNDFGYIEKKIHFFLHFVQFFNEFRWFSAVICIILDVHCWQFDRAINFILRMRKKSMMIEDCQSLIRFLIQIHDPFSILKVTVQFLLKYFLLNLHINYLKKIYCSFHNIAINQFNCLYSFMNVKRISSSYILYSFVIMTIELWAIEHLL